MWKPYHWTKRKVSKASFSIALNLLLLSAVPCMGMRKQCPLQSGLTLVDFCSLLVPWMLHACLILCSRVNSSLESYSWWLWCHFACSIHIAVSKLLYTHAHTYIYTHTHIHLHIYVCVQIFLKASTAFQLYVLSFVSSNGFRQGHNFKSSAEDACQNIAGQR